MKITEPAKPIQKVHQVVALVVLVMVIAVFFTAQAAAFTHMKDWTLKVAPEGTSDWFGWANAIISEVTPVAGMLALWLAVQRGTSRAVPGLLVVYGLTISTVAQTASAGTDPSISTLFVTLLPAASAFILLKVGFGMLDLLGLARPVREANQTPAQSVAQPGPAAAVRPNRTTPDHTADEAVQPKRSAPVHSVPDQVDQPQVDHPERARREADHSGPDQVDQEPAPTGTDEVDQADQMARAIDDVLADRLSIRAAATRYGVRRATLADRVKERRPTSDRTTRTTPLALPAAPFQLPAEPEIKTHNGHAVAARN